MDFVTLNNGIKMPIIGYGTFQTPLKATADAVSQAIAAGYRSFDTAQVYGNEAGVGSAIQASGIDRSEFFITSKTQTRGYTETSQGLDASLQRLGTDYFDMLIIHWPTKESLETYRALEDGVKAGKIRAIGVSNFNGQQLKDLVKASDTVPAVDQIETHLFWQQQKMSPILQELVIVHEAWAPLAESQGSTMMKLPEIQLLAEKYQATPAQVLLRFLTQQASLLFQNQ
ncbi:aldo/keto reductase [Secundilactobacillus paracollinoides]|uniref:aldo/keto reductase n=1 Tax=Secundilactobacillus paracollinoides TaxID=240427 RepID=UPI000AD7F917|nr:aldo/keto reductase [Secundilactobacillus paracollinoides]